MEGGDIHVRILRMTGITVNYNNAMNKNNIFIFETLDLLSISLAEELYKKINELSGVKDKISIAISGGNTPKPLFRQIAKNYSKSKIWGGVHIYWVDERCVPPDDSDSNYRMAKKSFIEHLEIPSGNINRIRGEEIPSYEAKRYSELVMKSVNKKHGLPSFDITLLGVGDDGHTASIFPDQMHLLDSPEIYSQSVHPSTKQSRITMTGRIINNSGYIYFLVSGQGKAVILGAILNKEPEASAYPANFISSANNNLNWFLDAEAARYLAPINT